jgi:23S rRNA A1618 N6-methylase RlmF
VSDLVERLVAYADKVRGAMWPHICDEAATRIQEQEKIIHDHIGQVNRLMEDNEAAEKALLNCEFGAATLVATLRQRIAELEAWLSVFVPPSTTDMEKALWGDKPDSATMRLTVKLGDYRRARAALSRQRDNEG